MTDDTRDSYRAAKKLLDDVLCRFEAESYERGNANEPLRDEVALYRAGLHFKDGACLRPDAEKGIVLRPWATASAGSMICDVEIHYTDAGGWAVNYGDETVEGHVYAKVRAVLRLTEKASATRQAPR
jgi:hypothetical protein